jgi:hypothetical protein
LPVLTHKPEANIESIDEIGGELFDLPFARLARLYARDVLRLAKCTAGRSRAATRPFRIITSARVNLCPEIEAYSELVRTVLEADH